MSVDMNAHVRVPVNTMLVHSGTFDRPSVSVSAEV